jgi:hypothetical protein
MLTLPLLLAIAAPSAVSLSGTNTVYVDASATGAAIGTSWLDAYTDLQTALANTTSGEIWVAAGTYLPSQTGDATQSFELANGLALYGGFAGGESSLAERDVAANPTVLSGDILQDDTYGPSWNWWQFGWTGGTTNSHHIVDGVDLDGTARLDGFTLLAGYAGSPNDVGMGVRLVNSSPVLANLVWEKNAYGVGSAMSCNGGSPVVRDCLVKDGYAFGRGPSGFWFTGGAQPLIEDCRFENHYMVATQGMGRGAAVSFDFGTLGTVRRSEFVECQTGNFFAMGAPSGAYGGGIYNLGAGLLVEDCLFDDNYAHAGAGIYSLVGITVRDSLFIRNFVLPYPVTSAIDYGDAGAGIYIAGSGTPSRIEGCSFTENTAEKGAGLACYSTQDAVVRNSILWGNYGKPTPPGEDVIWPLKEQIVGNYDLAYCDVYLLLTTEPGEDPPDPAKFPGCFDADPPFASGGFGLGPSSPCVDAGDNGEVVAGNLFDQAGLPRFADDPNVPDTGAGVAPLVDLGCLERGLAPPLVADVTSISLSAGGSQGLTLSAPSSAGEVYWVLGTASGTLPGIAIEGLVVPLNYDAYTGLTLSIPNQGIFVGTLGLLDGAGGASAAVVFPAGISPSLAGTTLHHAFVTIGTSLTFASNAVPLTLTP